MLFEDCFSAQVVEGVLAGRFAIGVCTLMRDEPELRCLQVLEAPLGLLVKPDRILPPTISNLKDLKGLPLIRYADDALITRILRAHNIAFDAYFNSPIQGSNVPGSFPLVWEEDMIMLATGIGATQPPAKGLRFIPLPGLLPSVKVSLISRRSQVFDGPQQIMLDLVKSSILETKWHASVQRLADVPL